MLIRTLEDIHKCNLELLCEFDTFCKKNDIHYFIFGGTLLGAVRNKDLIPWDDDIDVFLLRNEYEKLLAIPENEYPDVLKLVGCGENGIFFDFTPRIVYLSYEGTRKDRPDDSYPYMNNPAIDLFVLDNSCGGLRHRTRVHAQQFVYAMARGHRIHRSDDVVRNSSADISRAEKLEWITRPIQSIGKYVPLNIEIACYQFLSKMFGSGKSLFVSNDTPHGLIREYDASWFDETVPLEICGMNFPAPSGYDELLIFMYGDYMKLPPERSRVPFHFLVCPSNRADTDGK